MAATEHIPADPAGVAALAADHGLTVALDSVRLNEAGLDFRVAYVTTDLGEDWILRMPRRRDLAASIEREARVLRLVSAHLDVAVPHWQVVDPRLIAYRLLPGSPGLTLDDGGAPVWHVDVASRTYAVELGRLVAALHRIPEADVEAAGLELLTPAEVREGRRADLETVASSFRIAPALHERWREWLEEDSYWPTSTVFTHGELYPAHVLLDPRDRITGVLDWTTAGMGDPARDLMYQVMTAPDDVARLTLETYEEEGGRTWPRLREHAANLLSFGAVDYGLYALVTGREADRAAAAAQLDPDGAVTD